jgi:hypothetical protein
MESVGAADGELVGEVDSELDEDEVPQRARITLRFEIAEIPWAFTVA